MIYPKEFSDEVKKAFPDWIRLHNLLNEGSFLVGRALDDNRETGIPLDEVINATSLDDLKIEALKAQKINYLYHKWLLIENAGY